MEFIPNNKIFKITDNQCIKYVNEFTSITAFVSAFKKDYAYIRAFHASNLSDEELNNIRRDGLVTTSRELLRIKALSRFIKPTDPAELQASIKNDIDKFIDEEEYVCENELNFGLVKKPFIDDWYQYLLFGPESLIGLASKIKTKHGINFRERMKDYGSHCIIEATIPVRNVETDWIEAIYEYLNNGFPECSLVYHKNLPSAFLKIKKVIAPTDYHGFLYM